MNASGGTRHCSASTHRLGAFLVLSLAYGWSSFTSARELAPAGPAHDVGAMLAALPAAEFPLTTGVAREMGAYGADAHYELVLGALVEGLRVGSEP
jgi:hypothetical protein